MTTRWDNGPSAIDPVSRQIIDRFERRFRGHVRTTANPKGRVVRMPCTFCDFPAAEAHHLRYEPDWAFVIVWACQSCHRKIEWGTLKIREKDISDYSSLIARVGRPGGRAENRREPDTSFAFGANVHVIVPFVPQDCNVQDDRERDLEKGA